MYYYISMQMKKTIISTLILVVALAVAFIIYNFDYVKEGVNTLTNKELESGPVVSIGNSPKFGKYLADSKGRTLYVYALDKNLESVCVLNNDCLVKWPPFMYDAKDLKVFTDPLTKRMNVIPGTAKVWPTYAYGEKPLYYYAGDKNPGDINGHGIGDGKWSIVPVTQ